AGNHLRVRPGLVETAEAVSAQGALGKDSQAGAAAGRLEQALDHRPEVAVDVRKGDIHLHAGDFHHELPRWVKTQTIRVCQLTSNRIFASRANASSSIRRPNPGDFGTVASPSLRS